MKPPIVVTGCQRGGTRIAAQILSYDLGLKYVDESEFVPYRLPGDSIVHAPFLLNEYLTVYYANPGVHFVGVVRGSDAILASMKRIQWMKDEVVDWDAFLIHYVSFQQRLWKQLKKELPKKSWSEVNYNNLQSHPLFVPKDQRADFHALQWQVGKPVGPRYWTSHLSRFTV